MNKIEALNAFWKGFGLPAYDETHVPTGTKLPYITYETSEADFGTDVAQTASLWYRSESWRDISAKAKEIHDAITRGGKLIKYDDGAFWIRRATPWAQRMADTSDDMIRRVVLNIEVEFID